MKILATWTREQREFEDRMQAPLLRMIGLICLVGAIDIGLLFWTVVQGSFHRWHYPIVIGGFCATQMLMVGWFSYVNAQRKRRAGGPSA